MIKWGDWTARSTRGGPGRVSGYPAYNLVHIRGTAGGNDPVDFEVLQIDRVMGELRISRPELYEVGYEVYVMNMSYCELAERLRCHRNTITNRLNVLHITVEKQIAVCHSAEAATNKAKFS